MSEYNPCLLPEVDICGKYNITNAWCPPGWNNLVCDALDQIFALPFASEIQIYQIKEKFGTLRIYFGIEDGDGEHPHPKMPVVDLIVREAEKRAGDTCQKCGDKFHENSSCIIPPIPFNRQQT